MVVVFAAGACSVEVLGGDVDVDSAGVDAGSAGACFSASLSWRPRVIVRPSFGRPSPKAD